MEEGKNMIRNCRRLWLARQSSTELKHIKKPRERRNQTELESSYNTLISKEGQINKISKKTVLPECFLFWDFWFSACTKKKNAEESHCSFCVCHLASVLSVVKVLWEKPGCAIKHCVLTYMNDQDKQRLYKQPQRFWVISIKMLFCYPNAF